MERVQSLCALYDELPVEAIYAALICEDVTVDGVRWVYRAGQGWVEP